MRGVPGRPKAADIPDEIIFALVQMDFTYYDMRDFLMPKHPRKVILAKLRQMINKGRLEGCGCGCRGDFFIPLPYGSWRVRSRVMKG